MPALLPSIRKPLLVLPSSSVSLSYFILAVPMHECSGKHSCMSSPFPKAILNGTFLFRSVKTMNNWKRIAIKQILLTNYSANIIIIYHGFLPPPRRGSRVKSENTLTIINIHSFAHLLDICALIFSSCALFTFIPTASCNGIPPLSR